ncbi:MAG: dihydrofolate reductase family protein [Saprospiraceae bacterium]|nr:dihydrofolate reductase [Lewinellaceae bacterium]
MRKLILNVAVSLDGLIEGPNGEYDWCFTDQDYGMKAFFNRIDAVFMGRKSYDLMLSLENGMDDFPKMEQYVFSNSLQEPAPGWTLIQGSVEQQVREIKSRPGKDIWLFGGAALTANLLNAGLVDELSLAVHPIVLGSGKPLFSGIPERIPMQLLDAKTYSSGMVILTYTLPS